MQNNTVQSSLLQAYLKQAGINAQIGVNNTPQHQPAVNLEQKPDLFQKEGQGDEKKSKIAKYALLASVGISVTAGLVAAFRHKGGIVKTAKESFGKLKGLFAKGSKKTNEALQNAKNATEGMADLQKGADNINNAKDSLMRHFLMKIPGYEKFDTWASGIYKKSSLKTLNKTYTKAKNAVFKADDALFESAQKNGLDETRLSRLKDLIAKRREKLTEFTSQEAIKSRIDKIDGSIQRLDEDAWSTIRGLKEEGFINGARRLSKKALAEERLQQAKKLQSSLITPYKNMGLTDDEAKEFMEIIEAVTKNSSSSELTRLVSGAKKTFGRAFNKEKVDFFEKIRDINYGCAPADIIGTASTIGTLGLYTAQADTKEERVGVTLTTGIPLVVSLGTTIAMTTKMIGGAKALILGALTGLGANVIGSQINKKYQEVKGTKNAPKTIVTFDDYANTAKEKADKLIHLSEKTAY